MAGTTVSFIADPKLAARVKEIARSDGVTQSQAAARASALGAMLPPVARKTFRYILEEAGDDAHRQLAAAIAKVIARSGNMLLERQLLADASAAGLPSDADTEENLAQRAVNAVADYRRDNAGGAARVDPERDSVSARRR